jgi:CBS domain-containing protein
VAFALLAIFVAILVSKMEYFSMPTPNTCIVFALDFLAHFPSYIIRNPSIKTWCTVKYISLIINNASCRVILLSLDSLLVSAIMSRNVKTVVEERDIRAGCKTMSDNDIGSVVIKAQE